MLRALAVAGAALAALAIGLAVQAQTAFRYLVSDPTTVARVTHCVYTRGVTVTETPVDVSPAGKSCRFDLVAMKDPRTGTVTVAFKDSVAGEVGPSASFTFPDPLSAPAGIRLSN